MRKANPRLLAAGLCYWIGDLISRPMVNGHGWLYPLYARLMCWSSKLDDQNVIWNAWEGINEVNEKDVY